MDCSRIEDVSLFTEEALSVLLSDSVVVHIIIVISYYINVGHSQESSQDLVQTLVNSK